MRPARPARQHGSAGSERRQGRTGQDGPSGASGVDGADGVGIARIESEFDNAFTVILTDGTRYEIEMPLVTADNADSYKVSGGGSGSGVVMDLVLLISLIMFAAHLLP